MALVCRPTRRGRTNSVLAQLAIQIFESFVAPVILQIFFQPAQRDTDDIAVMQLRAKNTFAQSQPQHVQAVEVFRPEARWVRTQIDVC
jgi:hypothetical protein